MKTPNTFIPTLLFGAALLVPMPSYSVTPALEEVVITASKIEMPLRKIGVSISVIDAQEIQQRGYQDIASLLRTVPGVGVSNVGGAGKDTGIRIRGEESFRTQVLIDGVNVADPSGPQSSARVQHFGSALQADRVEVLRGPQGFIYGADAGGIVSVTTRTPEQFEANVAYEGGSFSTKNFNGFVGNASALGSVGLSVSSNRTEGFSALQSDTTADADGYENTTVHLKGKWNVGKSSYFQLIARSVDALNEYDNCGFPTVHDCKEDVIQRIGKLSVGIEAGRAKHEFGVSNMSVERRYFTSSVAGYNPDASLEKLEYLGSVQLGSALTMLWGGDYLTESVESTYLDKTTRSQSAVFSELQGEVNDHFYWSAGARYDDAKQYGEHVSMRLSPALVVDVAADATLKVLTEETSEGGDFGLELYCGQSWVSVGIFDQKIEDEIYFDLDLYQGYFIAEGISHSQGVEFAFDVPVNTLLTLSGNYTYNKTLTESDNPRVRRPRRLANITALVLMVPKC